MTNDKKREMALRIVQNMMSYPDLRAQDFFAVLNAVLCNSITSLVEQNDTRRALLSEFCKDAQKLLEDIIKDENRTLN